MELQASLTDYEQNGIAVFAISYDPVDALRDFSAKYGIRYPLLSDEGSAVIRRLGLLNERLEEHHAFYGGSVRDDQRGVPYPGAFVLDEQGVIVEKRFEDSYRERETAAGLLEAAFGARSNQHGSVDSASDGGVHVRAYLDSPTYRTMQQLRLTVELSLADGVHVYGEPIPPGYVPLSVEVSPIDGLVIGETQAPQPHPFAVAGLDEQFQVYDGAVRLSVPLTFGQAAGDITVHASVRFQACRATDCQLPSRLTLALPVRYLPHVERPA